MGKPRLQQRAVKKRTKRAMTGLRPLEPHSISADHASARMDASDVRRKMQSLVKRTPQVMVRVSGGGKSIRHIKAHLDYISRNRQIPLADQNGDKRSRKADVGALRDEWQFGGIAMDDGATSKQAFTFNIILSMPAGISACPWWVRGGRCLSWGCCTIACGQQSYGASGPSTFPSPFCRPLTFCD